MTPRRQPAGLTCIDAARLRALPRDHPAHGPRRGQLTFTYRPIGHATGTHASRLGVFTGFERGEQQAGAGQWAGVKERLSGLDCVPLPGLATFPLAGVGP